MFLVSVNHLSFDFELYLWDESAARLLYGVLTTLVIKLLFRKLLKGKLFFAVDSPCLSICPIIRRDSVSSWIMFL